MCDRALLREICRAGCNGTTLKGGGDTTGTIAVGEVCVAGAVVTAVTLGWLPVGVGVTVGVGAGTTGVGVLFGNGVCAVEGAGVTVRGRVSCEDVGVEDCA